MNESTRLEEIFSEALKLREPEQRRQYVHQACAGNAELARQVFSLLSAAEEAASFLELPAWRRGEVKESGLPTDNSHAKPAAAEFPFLEAPIVPGDLGSLGPYRILNSVGRGGMGIVFRGLDPKLQRVVAIKVLAPEIAIDPISRQRFEREARSAAAVSHPHCVVIYAVDENHHPPYIVMEYIEGKTLAQKIATQGTLSVKEILRIGGQIADGLAAAHKQGLIHRDMKPANVLLENGVERAKVADFGLARMTNDTVMTRTGVFSGTPQFMSPEQASGETVDHRTDLFSLGAILYTMCTGKPPFTADNPLVTLKRICEETPRPVGRVNPEIPDWLSEIIDRLLAKSPADRFQTAAEVADLLQKHLATLQAGPIVSQPIEITKSRTMTSRSLNWRSPLLWLAGGAIVVAALVLAGRPLLNRERQPRKSDIPPIADVSKSQSAPQPEKLPRTHKNGLGMEFVLVPKGKSWLGGGVAGLMGEKEVDFKDDFYLGKYEVTHEEWEAVTGSNPSVFKRNGHGHKFVLDVSDEVLKQFPVETVSWDDAQNFVKELNQREQVEGWLYRLPTEEEWEYACRGGPNSNKFDSAYNFFFDDPTNVLLPNQANFDFAETSLKRTCQVGSYQPNRLGLYDMHGNVLEHCDDEWKEASEVRMRVQRGGCWGDPSVGCAAAYRVLQPSNRNYYCGLRLARVPVSKSADGKLASPDGPIQEQ